MFRRTFRTLVIAGLMTISVAGQPGLVAAQSNLFTSTSATGGNINSGNAGDFSSGYFGGSPTGNSGGGSGSFGRGDFGLLLLMALAGFGGMFRCH